MVFSFLYVAVRALLGALVRSRRCLHGNDIELLVLRDELEILGRPGRARQVAAAEAQAGRSGAARRGGPSSTALLAGACSWRLPGRFCVGIRRLCVGSGDRQLVGAGGRGCRLTLGSWSCGSRGRTHVGAMTDLRRAREARCPRVADKHPPPALPDATGPAPRGGGPSWRGFGRSGGEHRRLRLLHRRQHLPSPLLRAVLHHACEPARLAGRLHGQPDRRLGDPAGTQSRPRVL